MPEHDNPLVDALNQMNEPKTPGQALQHSHESFPVLKAFQDYLETERRKMRQRTMLVTTVAVAASLGLLIPLIVAGMFLFSGMNASQDRLVEAQYRTLETLAGIKQNQNQPIHVPAPVVPASVVQDFENKVSGEFGRAVDGLTKAVESMQREVKTTVATEQTFEASKVYAVMLDVQEQLKGINEELNTLRSAPPAAAAQSPAETVSPVRPSSEFPDLAERWEQRNQQAQPQAQTPPALADPQARPLQVIEPRPLQIVEPRPLLVVEPNRTPAQQEAVPPPRAVAATPENPLKLEFSNVPGRGAQPATLALPAPDGSAATWRLVVPAGN